MGWAREGGFFRGLFASRSSILLGHGFCTICMAHVAGGQVTKKNMLNLLYILEFVHFRIWVPLNEIELIQRLPSFAVEGFTTS